MEFGNRLSYLRKRNKWSRDDLANRLGVSYSTISKYESGSREPGFETLQKISNIFDVTTDYLIGKTDNPNASEKSNNPSRAFYNFDEITDQEKEYLEEQLKIFRKLKDNK
ncbi:transcriptional regulator [Oceanobacillus limi]|uniref:Transcriptional regulator n=1 Tax=Oceanobacillus limi TaxID=930131 RepID=A0A1I0GZR2_9BACI|nr:helix-turn-helix transcriptional regulator [Oceanobacillus limi]SET76751.1 transcriptional regulator [Oceanobacillus limi]